MGLFSRKKEPEKSSGYVDFSKAEPPTPPRIPLVKQEVVEEESEEVVVDEVTEGAMREHEAYEAQYETSNERVSSNSPVKVEFVAEIRESSSIKKVLELIRELTVSDELIDIKMARTKQ